ncbi:unnamed protein product [Echinostoma caproni]|uniref:TFIIIC_delta domain-containing protein n=1 Tax=Echinostoma caproni TaxID=27848 RepID=A0A183AET7_9TREM|nr:unnamed protein product [Echinostoma caproni]
MPQPLATPRTENANDESTERSDPPRDDMPVDEDSTADLRTSQTPDALNNASVFSLPAISPDLWTADRPVWIMGVPVGDGETADGRWLATMDTCDVILLREKQADCPEVVTGSASSVYAFHVRPPSRLRPTNHARQTRSHGRARSLGRILLSDKQPISKS